MIDQQKKLFVDSENNTLSTNLNRIESFDAPNETIIIKLSTVRSFFSIFQ